MFGPAVFECLDEAVRLFFGFVGFFGRGSVFVFFVIAVYSQQLSF